MAAASNVSLALKVVKSPDAQAALANLACVSEADFATLKSAARTMPRIGDRSSDFVELRCAQARNRALVFKVVAHASIKPGEIGLSTLQRKTADVSNGDSCVASVFAPTSSAIYAGALQFAISFFKKAEAASVGQIDTDYLYDRIMSLMGGQFFTQGQEVLIDYRGVNLVLKVNSIVATELAALTKKGAVAGDPPLDERGLLNDQTDVSFAAGASDVPLQLSGAATAAPSLFKQDWSFENLGIGGLDEEFSNIFRRAFTSRVFPPSVVARLGIKHVKGILLYGPPGTGKTLMARQIGKMLNAKEPIVVDGPSIFDKYVGGSEAKVRELFAPAEADQARFGENSPLHIIIFDEFDAIAKQRGSRSGDTGAGDQVVNQLLAKMDGVNSLSNILIIGMTNRKDMIDEAMLRPGRLEVHMEIHLPDEHGRLQIFQIHTRKLREAGALAPDVSLADLAARTKNFSGSEIHGLIGDAMSFALSRQVDITGGSATEKDAASVMVTNEDFDRALAEYKPQLGTADDDFAAIMQNGIIAYSREFEELMDASDLLTKQIKNSSRTSLLTCLLSGPAGSGKSAVAVKIAQDSGIPFVRIIQADQFVALSELTRCDRIVKAFQDAYKSPISVLIIDDIERIVDWVALGSRFSNPALQALMAFLKKPPPAGHKLMVLATTSSAAAMDALGLTSCFNGMLSVPVLRSGEQVAAVLRALNALDEPQRRAVADAFHGEVPIKKLLMMIEMALQGMEPSETLMSLLLSNELDGIVHLNSVGGDSAAAAGPAGDD
eukprot:a842539_18.p1 GENE.a842539_18~~a842539_18.p1  ORF type:complete len:788 (-),score=433.86 a842539_18:18-2348(-)